MQRAIVLALFLVVLLLAACSAGQETVSMEAEPAVAMADSGDSGEMASEEMASEEMDAEDGANAEHPDEAMDGQMTGESEDMDAGSEEAAAVDEPAMDADLPAWQTLPLTNARTGETFTLADYAGRTIFVEPMATWCTNCRRQLGNVKDAHAQLAGDDVVFVALSVETSIGDGTLANYANEAGFDWTFAVLTPEMLQALASEFGQTIANPPATPHFVIRPDGTATDLFTGIEPAGDIIAQIQAAQG